MFVPGVGWRRAQLTQPSSSGRHRISAAKVYRRNGLTATARPNGMSVVSRSRFVSAVSRDGTYQLSASDRCRLGQVSST